jgi:hypothetical protein
MPYPPMVPITSMPYESSPTSFHPYKSYGVGMVHGHNLYHIVHLVTLRMQLQEEHNHM